MSKKMCGLVSLEDLKHAKENAWLGKLTALDPNGLTGP